LLKAAQKYKNSYKPLSSDIDISVQFVNSLHTTRVLLH